MKLTDVKRKNGLIAPVAFLACMTFVSSASFALINADCGELKTEAQSSRIESEADTNAKPILVLKQIRNTGGALLKSKNGKPLNESLTTGLFELLKERSKEGFVIFKGRAPGRASEQRLFTLEEDISHTETDGEDGGPYLLTARLYEEEGKRHRLAAQWTGYADTFRNLTSNLRGDRRVSREGLLGLLADRLKEALLASSLNSDYQSVKKDFQDKTEASKRNEPSDSSESRPPAQLLEVGNVLKVMQKTL